MVMVLLLVVTFRSSSNLTGAYGIAVVGAMLAQASSVLDGVDGETARLQDRASERGSLLDAMCDRMVDVIRPQG